MSSDLARFSKSGTLLVDAGCGGLPRLSFATPLCRGEIYLNGAHITAWQPTGQAPVIWMSSQSWFQTGKPIRGGIPICWPWFGPSAEAGKPAHGLARLQLWTLDSAAIEADGTVAVALRLGADASTRALFAQDFNLRLTARFGRRLEVALSAENTGKQAFPVGEALHTYLAMGDVRRVRVEGLDGAAGFDRVAEPKPLTQRGAITVGAETDLAFHGTTSACTIHDPVWNRAIRVGKSGSGTTVVWNPWIAKSQKMVDYGDHEWPGMICVESANAGADVYQLAPGASHTLGTTIEVL